MSFIAPVAVLNGRLFVTIVSATHIEDVRTFSSMDPYLIFTYGNLKATTPIAKGGGANPKWHFQCQPIDIIDQNPANRFTIEVIDDKVNVGNTSIPLGDLIAKTIQVSQVVNSDQLVRWPLTSGKDKSKLKGEVQLAIKWMPAPPRQQVQPQMQQMQPTMQMQQPPRPVQLVSQPMYGQPQMMPQPMMQPMQPMQQLPPMQPMQMQPMQPMQAPPMQSYPPQQLVYSPPPPMQVYGQPQMLPPQPMPQPMMVQQQQFSPPPMQMQPQHAAPVMPIMQGQCAAPPPQQAAVFTPQTSNDDGVFPFAELKITRLLGEGTFGTVSAGEFRSTPVAIKQLKQTVFNKAQWDEFMSEVKFLREARHPNIVLFMGVSYNPYSIVTELLDMSLFDVLYKHKMQLTHKQKVHIAISIARGLASLHGHPVPIIHRDLKSLNILVSKDLVSVKICDLGMVKFKAAYGQKLESAGTPLWQSPEVLLDQPYDESADVFSFGSLLYELTTATIPFGGGNISKAELAIRVGKNSERPVLPNNLEKHWRDLLIQVWQQHPLSRPKMSAVVATIAAIPV